VSEPGVAEGHTPGECTPLRSVALRGLASAPGREGPPPEYDMTSRRGGGGANAVTPGAAVPRTLSSGDGT
jgi:hypothetical protein